MICTAVFCQGLADRVPCECNVLEFFSSGAASLFAQFVLFSLCVDLLKAFAPSFVRAIGDFWADSISFMVVCQHFLHEGLVVLQLQSRYNPFGSRLCSSVLCIERLKTFGDP